VIIHSKFTPSGDLEIDVYSENTEDFDYIEGTLRAARIPAQFLPLPPEPHDPLQRDGRKYFVQKHEVQDLESLLNGSFHPTGQLILASSRDDSYACHEMVVLRGTNPARGGIGRGCENFTAQNFTIAVVKCAFIAGNNNWFGGVAYEGRCP
jgi:hypothetical protein